MDFILRLKDLPTHDWKTVKEKILSLRGFLSPYRHVCSFIPTADGVPAPAGRSAFTGEPARTVSKWRLSTVRLCSVSLQTRNLPGTGRRPMGRTQRPRIGWTQVQPQSQALSPRRRDPARNSVPSPHNSVPNLRLGLRTVPVVR